MYYQEGIKMVKIAGATVTEGMHRDTIEIDFVDCAGIRCTVVVSPSIGNVFMSAHDKKVRVVGKNCEESNHRSLSAYS